MLSTQATPAALSTAIDLLHHTQFTQAQQAQIEQAITAIAHHYRWTRDRAAFWLYQQAFG